MLAHIQRSILPHSELTIPARCEQQLHQRRGLLSSQLLIAANSVCGHAATPSRSFTVTVSALPACSPARLIAMSTPPNPLFQYFPATSDGRVCSTCQAPFGPKTGNSTMRRHLQRTHPQQMQQYINQGGSMPGSTPAKVKPPGAGTKQSRKSAPPSLQQDETFNGTAHAAAPSTISSSPLAPTLPPLPQLPLVVTPTFGPPTSTSPLLPSSLSTSAPSTSSSTSSSAPSAFCPPGTSSGVPFSDCSLEQIRLAQQQFSNERQWLQYHTPRNLLLALVGEVGELAECFQWREDAEPGLPAWTTTDREAVSEELSDVLLYLVRLSDRCGIDLGAAVQRKQAINAGKYPAKRVRGKSDKYTKYVKEEEGKDDEPGSAVNGEAAGEGRKQRKKRKTRSVDNTTSDNAAAEEESKQPDGSPSAMDDRKEPVETNNIQAD